MKYLKIVVAMAIAWTSTITSAQDIADRAFIRKGMHEAEVLFKIGKPDHEASIRDAKCGPEEKTWAYFPRAGDAQTLTIITIRAGVVDVVERKIAR